MKEDFLQYKLSERLRQKEILFFHVPNGGKRSKREAAKFVAMGVRAGVHDLVVLLDKGVTVFIEVKVGKGVLSKSQEKFHEEIKMVSHNSHLLQSDSVEDGLAQLEAILALYD